MLKPLAAYILDKHGPAEQQRIAASAGLTRAELDGRSCGVSFEQFERVLAEARELVGSDEAFLEACAYGFKQQPAWLVMIASSPQVALPRLPKLARSAVTHISSFESIRDGHRWTIRGNPRASSWRMRNDWLYP